MTVFKEQFSTIGLCIINTKHKIKQSFSYRNKIWIHFTDQDHYIVTGYSILLETILKRIGLVSYHNGAAIIIVCRVHKKYHKHVQCFVLGCKIKSIRRNLAKIMIGEMR